MATAAANDSLTTVLMISLVLLCHLIFIILQHCIASKPRMAALAACMRKILMIVYGVLKHQKLFDAGWQSQPTHHHSKFQIKCIKTQ